MRAQPNRDYKSEDSVMTPQWLADMIVTGLEPTGVILEPCAGEGAFLRALEGRGDVRWCEIERGRDFLEYDEPVDWIITNPPWRFFADFLIHSLTLAQNIAFLVTVNHWWTKRRVREVVDAGFGYRRLILTSWPREFQPTGFQLGVMHLKRGHSGALQVDDWREATSEPDRQQTLFTGEDR